MYSPQEIFDNNFLKLDEKWTQLSNLKLDAEEFEKLYQETLRLTLDFRMEFADNSIKAKFLQTMCTTKLTNHERESFENLSAVPKWTSSMATALLSGKLITRGSKTLAPLFEKFLLEDDIVVHTRIDALLQLLENSNTEESSQMILNALDTYKKHLLCETDLQNKLSYRTIEILVKALLTILCHRKEHDHLNSMIKFLPLQRKVKFLVNEIQAAQSPEHSVKLRKCQLFICSAIALDLFQSEFKKPKDEQSMTNFNVYANIIIDLAVHEHFVSSQLDRIFLSANNMNVVSECYYMIANMLMFKMPNRHDSLIVKLISIGISHDLTNLEQIKYTKDNATLKWTEEDFVAVYRKMFVALATLGFFIKEYSLRRLCIQAASVCEPSTKFCCDILEVLPECDPVMPDEMKPEMKVALEQLREQLETFQSAIKMKVELPKTWEKASILCYEKLDFHHRRTLLSDDLKPLEYPGVERYLKRAKVEDAEEAKPVDEKPLNATTILEESDSFAVMISSRFKQIKNPFKVESDLKPPTPSEVSAVITNLLRNSQDFEIGENGEVFMNLSTEGSVSGAKDCHTRWSLINTEQQNLNKPNLFFDFNMDETDEKCDVSSMYQNGTVRVLDLCRNGCSVFDIENVMLYAITEKKMLYMQQEFVELNKNPVGDGEQSFAHAAFEYLSSKHQPEHSRLSKLSHPAYTSTSMLEYCIETYNFDLLPRRNYQKKKNLDASMKEESEFNGDEQMDTTVEMSKDSPMELPEELTANGQEVVTKKLPQKSPKVPKNMPPKVSITKKEVQPRPKKEAQPRAKKEVQPRQKKEAQPRLKKEVQPKLKKENVVVAKDETFHVSEHIMAVLLLMENGFSHAVGSKVSLDIKSLNDETSMHKVELTNSSTSTMTVKILKRRNSQACPMTMHQISLPARVHGVITAYVEVTDKIEYDKSNDNPFIKSSAEVKFTGMISFDHSSHNIKDMDLMCTVNGVGSKFRFSMKGGSRGFRSPTSKHSNEADKERRNESEKDGNTLTNDLNNSLTRQTPPKTVNSLQTSPHARANATNAFFSEASTNQPPSFGSNQIPDSFKISPMQHVDRPPSTCPVQVVNPMITTPDNKYGPESPNLVKNVSSFEQALMACDSIDMRDGMAAATLMTLRSPVYQQNIENTQHSSMKIVTEPLPLVTITQQLIQPEAQFSLCSMPVFNVEPDSVALPMFEQQNSVAHQPEAVACSQIKIEKFQILNIENVSAPINPPNVQTSVDPIEMNFMMNATVFRLKPEPIEMEPEHYLDESFPYECKTELDFDDEITPCIQITNPRVDIVSSQEQTPPTSPPPLHYPDEVMKEAIKSELCKLPKYRRNINPTQNVKREIMDVSADRIMNNTPPDEVIDLTEEFDYPRQPFGPKRIKGRPLKKPRPTIKPTVTESPFAFVSCEDEVDFDNTCFEMLTKEVKINPTAINEAYSRILKKAGFKNMKLIRGPKRSRLSSDGSDDASGFTCRQSEVHLVDVMQHIDQSVLKTHMSVNATLVKLKLPPNREAFCSNRQDYQIFSSDLEQPYEDPHEYVSDASMSTFHFIYQNFVSYLFDDQSGDGIANTLLTANNQCNENFSPKPNLLKNILNNAANVNKNELRMSNPSYVDNNANDKILREFAELNLSKSFYSDKNCFNFTKNLKNCKKFVCWSPKINNDCKTDKLNDKLDEKKIADDKDLLYQMSHDLLKSIPGLNSLEFFQFPSTPRRMVHVEVIHIFKDMKNGSSSTSCDTSDTDGEQHSEANNLQSEALNGESAHASSTHVQKIGQTSINREGDPKTIQTSFGSIIKNTYPPATLSTRAGNGSEIVKTIEKEQQKYAKLKNDDVQIKKILSQEIGKTNSSIKIVACSSNAPQVDPQKINRNQTLINMLTQQVMLPTNSNRHFIITSRADVMKTENNITTVTSALPSHQNVVKKVVATQGQSQLVQILNSPPSSFTMKTLNTSVASSQAKPPNQIVTVSASGTNNNNNFKAELPTAAKQQQQQQGIVQFICKTDGKIIHLTPICNNSAGGSSKKITYKVDTSGAKGPTILHHANQQIIINNPLKKSDNQNILTIIQKQDDGDKKNKSPMLSVSQSSSTPTSPISTRSIYEETYAKFIQTSSSGKPTDMGLLTISSSPINSPITSTTQSSIIQKIGKTVIQSSNQVLPKFNQAFGKTIFATNSSLNEQMRNKIVGSKEIMTTRHMTVNFPDTKPVTKVTRTVSEIKSTDAGTLLSLIENESADKSLPTLQSALQSSMLYARPIGNGKLLASNSNNVLLTALRNNNQTGNVRIITSISDNVNRAGGAIMSPMRISVPIQIPKLINTSVRSQTPGTYRQQIVIATAPSRMPQTTMNSQQNTSKLESLLMTSQPTVVKQEVEIEQNHQQQQIKMEVKQKKNVDHSTLEQLREFDMVLEQVLERSSSEMTSTSMSSPPTPESSNHLSPKKQVIVDSKIKTEMKLNAVTITSISPSVSPSPKSVSSCANPALKVVPKLQEDEHTAQRILDILANYKEQVRNSPDLNNKPAPRRRANPPTNPPAAKRKKIVASGSMGSLKTSSKFGSTSDMMTDTMGSEEDSSCGMGSGVASTGSMNNSPQPQDIDDQTDVSMDNNFYMEDSKRETALSPQSSSSSVATSPSHNKFPLSRRLILTETKTSSGSEMSPSANKSIVFTNASTASSGSLGTSIERFAGHGSTAAVLMPGNYLLPMNVLKGGQQLAILSSNNGQKIIAVPTNQLVSNSSGTSIILQRYLNQANDTGNKTVLSTTDASQNAFKSIRLQQNPTVSYINSNNNNSASSHGNTLYIRPIQNMSTHHLGDTKTIISNHQTVIKQEDDATRDSQNSKFVSDKTLITEIIQQQQQLSHTHQHPQQNFMIKFNEHQPSDPRSSSSIMFVSNSNSTTSSFVEAKEVLPETPKIKIEEIDYDDYMREDAIDLLNESDSMAKSPMLNTKIEVDENTNSNHESNNLIYDDSGVKMENEQEQKFQHFPIILNSCHGKSLGVNHVSTSKNIKGFLIDPTNKIVMYSDRKPATVEKEFFNQKSFSEECADLGVDEPIASDLFPEADLLFDSDSPKFDQINSHDGTMHIKKELENGQVLLEMNYNHNMETESWLNFDTEEELVDDSQVVNGGGGSGVGHSGDLKAYF